MTWLRERVNTIGTLNGAVLPALVGMCLLGFAAAGIAAEEFDRAIAPLLAGRCLDCHSGPEPKGGLDLARRASAEAGGDSGRVIVPGKPDDSLLWEYVRDDHMPPEHPLSESDKTLLERWIAGGAAWGSDPIDPHRFTTDHRAGYDWWSLQAIGEPSRPTVGETDWPRRDLDRFVLARLEERDLSPSPETERRVLIRRLSFDLLGLPPTPEQVRAFVNDPDPRAYQRLVDRLLDSPHYGERWARHWLDVARFGESDGFEYDKPRPNAWPYRDWVIRALNQDMPYDRFARWQLAGDVLHPDDPDAITATGFLVAGAFDGLKPAGEQMRLVMRQDEMDDLVAVVGQTFLGLTINCARCHDHKFDPVRQEDYYRIASALAGVHRGDRGIPARDAGRLRSRIESLSNALNEIEAPARDAILRRKREGDTESALPEPLARWTFDSDVRDQVGSLHGETRGDAKVQGGALRLDGRQAYVSTRPLDRELRAKTLAARVILDNLNQRGGGVISVQTTDGAVFDAIVFGEREAGHWMAGSNNFQRTVGFQGEAETESDDKSVHFAIVYDDDGTITGYRDGKPYGHPYRSDGPVTFPADRSQVLFGLRHGTSAGGNRMLAAGIEHAELYDRALTSEDVAEVAGRPIVSDAELEQRLAPAERDRRRELRRRLADLRHRLSQTTNTTVFAVTPDATPSVVHVLHRGSPAKPGQVVAAGGVAGVKGLPSDFELPPDARDDDRRRRLADWITDSRNPLFARAIVNRIWHHHFGAGLVPTPNDLGFNGGRIEHQDLLDTLARHLVENRWSLKQLHREIVTSATYRQSSRFRASAAEVDADNRLLCRVTPRRLEAEAVRDAILSVAGQLNAARGGPGFEDFHKYSDKNTWRYDPVDRVGPEFNRRSIYRTWARGGRNPLLDTFDCPDPSTTTPARGVTTTPLQALALLNNAFVLRMSDHFAARVVDEAGPETDRQVGRAYALAFAREPAEKEVESSVEFIDRHGLPAFCRVMFNANEFLYVE